MKYIRFNLIEIWFQGQSLLRGYSYWFVLFWVLPFVISCLIVVWPVHIELDINTIDVLTSASAIFLGFLFTLMVYVADKAAIVQNFRYEFTSLTRAQLDYFNSHRDYSRTLLHQISYSIVVSVLMLVLLYIAAYKSVLFDGLTRLGLSEIADFAKVVVAWAGEDVRLKSLPDVPAVAVLIHLIMLVLLIISGMFQFVNNELSSILTKRDLRSNELTETAPTQTPSPDSDGTGYPDASK